MKKIIKSYIISLCYFIWGIYLIVGIDAFIKLKKGGFVIDTSLKIPLFQNIESGLPSYMWALTTVFLFLFIGCIHFKIFFIDKNMIKNNQKRMIASLLFLLNFFLCIQIYKIIYHDSIVKDLKVYSRYESF